MTAPDIDTLFMLEDHIETGVQRVLKSIQIKAFKQCDADDIGLTPYVNIQLALGGVTGHYGQDKKGKLWKDAWNATLGFEIVTNRSKKQIEHATYRAHIRRLMQYAEGLFTEEVMPYHTLTKIEESGTRPTFDGGEGLDISQVSFSCIVSIRQNAWPDA
jgi:hypothetical protein